MTVAEMIADIQFELYRDFGKVDIYHRVDRFQILAVEHGKPLVGHNVIFAREYTPHFEFEDVTSVG